jgi:hypothetical protein
VIPVELRFTKSGDTWQHTALHLPVVRTSGEGLPAGTTINGVKVDLGSQHSSTGLLVWPGRVSVKLPADKFTTYSTPVQTLKATDQLSSLGAGQLLNVDVQPKRTAEFNRQARAAAAANLKHCLSSTTLAPKNCPFGGSVSNSVSRIRNVGHRR